MLIVLSHTYIHSYTGITHTLKYILDKLKTLTVFVAKCKDLRICVWYSISLFVCVCMCLYPCLSKLLFILININNLLLFCFFFILNFFVLLFYCVFSILYAWVIPLLPPSLLFSLFCKKYAQKLFEKFKKILVVLLRKLKFNG